MGKFFIEFGKTLREFITHWVVAGLIVVATGFAPEEWVVAIIHGTGVPEAVAHTGQLGIDIRTVCIVVGMLIVIASVIFTAGKIIPKSISGYSEIVGTGPHHVYYSVPFQFIPTLDLQIEPTKNGTSYAVDWKDLIQRADGFSLDVTAISNSRQTLRWRATGIPLSKVKLSRAEQSD
ncbi:hypothetical protein QD357_01905 [Rhizobium sp. BR 317]|uniref:hypothetical protein n=1 Tax=Rhizobium sp. BR 317 TaxID=3040015 RepID=UPI0039BF7243